MRRGAIGTAIAATVLLAGGCASTEDTTTDRDREPEAAGSQREPKESASRTKSPALKDDKTTDSLKATDPPKETATPEEPKVDRDRVKRVAHLYSVLAVIDGDTVIVSYRGATSIRIIGIDTPETVDPNTPDECGGAQASALADQLLSGRRVRLVYDRPQGRTNYDNRTLAYIDIPGRGDFGQTMIERGAAAEYTYDTAYDRQAKYVAAERRAQSSSRGVWGKCGGVDTPLNDVLSAKRETAGKRPSEC